MSTSPATAAARGAALLDQFKPDWWHADNVDLTTLNQASISACILGQNYNGYFRGLDALRDNRAAGWFEAEDCGFSTNLDNYAELTEAWRSIITERRRGSAPLAAWERELLGEDVPEQPTFSLTHDQLVALVTEAMDAAPTRGAYSEIGLVASFTSNLR